ncbi:MAG TPA: N-acetylmuramoyl-L-alanine amidase [Dermatophilaceae bacterium]|nr:N-acetylmuramoyl-L-alanine amidase [Dermatophilaceae bacterium]
MSLSRRHFLLASAAGAAALAAPTDSAQASSPGVVVAVDEHDAFVAAATRYAVPPALLAAVGWVQSRWTDHAGAPSAAGGYGPMHLVDGALAATARAERVGREELPATLDTLGAAARLTGLAPDVLRTDPTANIAGAAAVLAEAQRRTGGATGTDTDPGSWYAAVAAVSGSDRAEGQLRFADQVLADLASGAAREVAGGRLILGPTAVGDHAPARGRLAERAAYARRHQRSGPVDAPPQLPVEWVPAPYEQYGPASDDYGNHDLAGRPESPTISHIVVHDTECTYAVALQLVTDPTYLAWQYTLRSSDGQIAQHLHPKDIGWHAGNWWMNTHSIGLEHEGVMVEGSRWYTEAMYRTSSTLVAHLARRYGIPLDRAHVIGHDQVPGITTSRIRGMHVDPGPYWDWEHYFRLIGAPLVAGTHEARRVDGPMRAVVRVLPGFEDNLQPLTVKGRPLPPLGTNFLYVRSSPADDAPLVRDLGLWPDGRPCSYDASDMGARASAGCDYVAVERQGDWLAIWFLGQLGWIHDPAHRPTTRVVGKARVVQAKGTTAAVYGRCYPEAAAYPNGIAPQAISPLVYQVGAGQLYPLTDAAPVTDYYKASTYAGEPPTDHVDIVGQDRYLQISYGQRVAFVRAAEVTVTTP